MPESSGRRATMDWCPRAPPPPPPPAPAGPSSATALDRLRILTADADADFRSGQLEAIRDVVADRARVLCVQRTGWGKSAVYFVAAALLREAGAGPTLIVSA